MEEHDAIDSLSSKVEKVSLSERAETSGKSRGGASGKRSGGRHSNNQELKCMFCQQECPTKNARKEHLLSEHGERVFMCDAVRCGQIFLNGKKELETHVLMAHEKLTCKKCSTEFSGQKALTKHMEKHEQLDRALAEVSFFFPQADTSSESSTCPVCRKSLRTSAMGVHMAGHDQYTLQNFMMTLTAKISKSLNNEVLVQAYGSRLSGLSLVDRGYSDLDLTLVGAPKPVSVTPPEGPMPWAKREYDRDQVEKVLHDVSKELKKMKDVFRVQPVLRARVPIVKFIHRVTKTECDLSIDNDGVMKSRVQRWLVEQYPAFGTLTRTVKQWARLVGFPDGSGSGLNSYAWSMIVLVYFQMHDHSHGKAASRIPALDAIDLQPIALDIRLELKKCSDFNTDSDLLLAFIHFFLGVEWEKVMFSPRFGKVMKRTEMHSGANRLLVVQDPFDLTDNCARSISENNASKLRKQLKKAADTLEAGQEATMAKITKIVNAPMKGKEKENVKESDSARVLKENKRKRNRTPKEQGGGKNKDAGEASGEDGKQEQKENVSEETVNDTEKKGSKRSSKGRRGKGKDTDEARDVINNDGAATAPSGE